MTAIDCPCCQQPLNVGGLAPLACAPCGLGWATIDGFVAPWKCWVHGRTVKPCCYHRVDPHPKELARPQAVCCFCSTRVSMTFAPQPGHGTAWGLYQMPSPPACPMRRQGTSP